ncbi:Hypothetical protein GLP15_1485 [Giardia lamblia P15]|uniref:Lecithin-cholesterol acyl transferase n=1 Tax=Giardia intestinalis (strain P15) TaxID=658858 RepID=E1EYQ3_GIAIA|nr:Hypothetical protein GLP15_1485 [Giardia lamblia P15]
MTTKPPPVLLIHGTVGSKMLAKSRISPHTEDAWVNSQIIPRMMIATKVANNLWCAPNPETLWVESHVAKYVDVAPYPGLEGARRLLTLKGFERMLRKRRIGYYYETLLQWFKKYCGYEEGITIDAFSYDWRQEIGHPRLQEDLRKCIKAMRCRNSGQRLTIIAHSLGGLVVQAYMQTYPDWNDDISRFVAISVPFDGVGGYSMAGFLTGYCLRLPIPTSCGRGIQGASGSIISMAGRPGGNPYSNEFISTNIYVKRLHCPRISSDSNGDSNNHDPGGGISSYAETSGDIYTEVATLIKDSADSQCSEKQPPFRIHLNLVPYRKKMPNLAYCILEKIQQDPSLLTKDVERSLTLLQNCCHRKAVQIEINGILYSKKRRRGTLFPEYAFNRAFKKLEALATPDEIGVVSSLYDFKYASALTKIVEDVAPSEESPCTTIVEVPATSLPQGSTTTILTVSPERQHKNYPLQKDTSIYQLDVNCGSLLDSIMVHYDTTSLTIPDLPQSKEENILQRSTQQADDFTNILDTSVVDSSDETDPRTNTTEPELSPVKIRPLQQNSLPISNSSFQLVNDHELSVVQNQHTGNPIFSWECYSPWITYSNENGTVIPQSYETKKLANIFSHSDFIFKGNTVTIREDSDFLTFYKETSGGFHSTSGRVIRWSEYPHLRRYSEITMLMDELAAEYENIPHHINYNGRIVKSKKCILNYPDLPKLRREKKVKKVETGEPKHLSKGVLHSDVPDNIASIIKKMDPSSIYVKERVSSAYAKARRASTDARMSVAEKFINCNSSSSSPNTDGYTDNQGSQDQSFAHITGEEDTIDVDSCVEFDSNSFTEETDNIVPNIGSTRSDSKHQKVNYRKRMRSVDSASSIHGKAAVKLRSGKESRANSKRTSRRTSLSFSDRASEIMDYVPSTDDISNLDLIGTPGKKDKEKDRIILVPYANPWSDLTLRKSMSERPIAELIDKVSTKGSLDALIFPKFDKCWSFSAQRQVKPIVYPVNPKDFRYISLLTYGRQTPIHVVYPKPIQEYSELLDQIPTFVTGQGDGTVILSSMLNDGIPDQYVDDRIVDYGVSHFNILHNFTTFTRIASFMGLSLKNVEHDQSLLNEEESSNENTLEGAFSEVVKSRTSEFAFYLVMFSHSRASTTANTRILRTFTLTGDEQGILGGFFRVLVNTIEIHGDEHLLVQKDVAGDHTPTARIWYSLLQSVCDNTSADDVLLSLAPLVSHLDLSPIESAEQHEKVISTLVHSLPETLRTNMFDHSFRCGGCGKLSHHTLLNFLQFDTSGTAVLNFSIQSIACPACAATGLLTVVQRPLLSVSTTLSYSSFPINQHQQLAPDYRVYNTAFMSSKVTNDAIEGTERHMESYTVFINTQDRRGSNDDYVLYSFMGSTLRAEARDKVSELTFLKTKKVAAYREGIPGNQLRQRIGPCRIIFYMDTKTFAPELRKQLAIPSAAPRQEHISPISPPISVAQQTIYSDAEPLKPNTPAPMYTVEHSEALKNISLSRTRQCHCCPCSECDCSGGCVSGCCKHLRSEAEECCNCVDDNTCCGRHLLLWIVIIIMAILLLITFILVICLYAQIGSTLTVNNLVVSNLSVLGPSAVTTTFRVKTPHDLAPDNFTAEMRRVVSTTQNRGHLDENKWMHLSLEEYKGLLVDIQNHCQVIKIASCPVTDTLLKTLDGYTELRSAYERATRYPSFYPRRGELLKDTYLSSITIESRLWDMLNAESLASIFVTAPPAACLTPTTYSCNGQFNYLKTADLDMQMTNVQATFQNLIINGKLTATSATLTDVSVSGKLDVTGSATIPSIAGLNDLTTTTLTTGALKATTVTADTMTTGTQVVQTQLSVVGAAPSGPYNLVVGADGVIAKKKLTYQDGANAEVLSVTDTGVTISSNIALSKAIDITNSGNVIFKSVQSTSPGTYTFTDNILRLTKTGTGDTTTITEAEINTNKITTQITSNSIDELCITKSINLCPTGATPAAFLTVAATGQAATGTINNVKTATIDTATISTSLVAPAVAISTNLSLGTHPNFDIVYAAKASNPPGTPASLTINTVVKSNNADVIDFASGAKVTVYVPTNFTKQVTITDSNTDKIKLEPGGTITTNNCNLAITGGTATLDQTKITITPPP